MTIQEAITKAVEGGWKDTSFGGDCEGGWIEHFCLDPSFWQALGKAMGWCDGRCQQGNVPFGMTSDDEIEWGACQFCVDFNRDTKYIPNDWRTHQHRLISHLQDGGSIESFFATL